MEPCKASAPAVRLPSGPKRGPFTVRVSSAGVSQITFYLDRRKLRTMKQSQAKGGHFTIKIDPRRLKLGPHKLSVKGTSTDPSCGTIAHASTFVRPSTAVRPVKFAG